MNRTTETKVKCEQHQIDAQDWWFRWPALYAVHTNLNYNGAGEFSERENENITDF